MAEDKKEDVTTRGGADPLPPVKKEVTEVTASSILRGIENWLTAEVRDTFLSADTNVWNALQAKLPALVDHIGKGL